MRTDEIKVLKKQLVDLRARTSQEVTSMVEGVREGGRAVGEHDACPSESAERAIILEHGGEELMDKIEAALDRIDEGKYGKCLGCERDIPSARLQAVPYAERCVKCEQLEESRRS